MNPSRSLLMAILLSLALPPHALVATDEFEREPISYSESTPDNAVSRLQDRLEQGETTIEYDSRLGYLEALLEELSIPAESQTLVFSKTSLQRGRISPRTPRAIYFNDEVYVGFCQAGSVLELSVADPQLGTVFYSMKQDPNESPRFIRETHRCLLCHSSTQTRRVPGHLVRSVFSDASGQPLLASGSFRVDHTTPFENRWGGWYVTGEHGQQKHLGNLIIRDNRVPNPVENPKGQNVTELSEFFSVDRYLTPHSDLVALLVLEHQTMAHNVLTQAGFKARQALHYEQSLNRELGESPDNRWESTTTRLNSATKALVNCFLFVDEAPLTDRVTGTSGYAEQFVKQGPFDRQGRSLRELDLERRLFKYPCSYLIYSPSFDALPDELRGMFWQRLFEILTGQDDSQEFEHLSGEDRQAILEILRDTKTDLPENWHDNPDES